MGLKSKTLFGLSAALLLSLLAFLISCSLQNPQNAADPDTGAVAPRLLFKSAAGTSISFPEELKTSIRDIKFEVSSEGKVVASARVDYLAKTATLSGIKAGPASLQVMVYDKMNANRELLRSTLPFTVEAGKTVTPDVTLEPEPSIAGKPYLTMPEQIAANAVKLNWMFWNTAGIGTVIKIRIVRQAGIAGGLTPLDSVGPEFTSYVDQQVNLVTARNDYVYMVEFLTGTGSIMSNAQAISTDAGGFTGFLEIPALYEAKSVGGSAVLNWHYKSMMIINQFIVERSITSKNGPFTEVKSGFKDTTWTDVSVTAPNSYWYRLKARGPSGESQWSSVVTVYVTSGGDALIPNLQGPGFSAGTVSLTWNFPATEESRIQRFEIFRSPDGMSFGTAIQQAPPNSRTLTDNGAPADQTVYYRVSAVDHAAGYHHSNVKSVFTGTASLAAPDGLAHTFEQAPRNFVRLTWNQPNEAAVVGWEVERSPPNTPRTWTQVGSSTAPVKVLLDTNVVSGQSYVYRIRANAVAGGTSAWSGDYSLMVPTGGGTCPTGMTLNTGYCIDNREFGSNMPTTPRGIDNITFTAAKDSCNARGKALCDVFEWSDACQKSQTGQPLAGSVYDMSGGGANDEEWCIGTTVTGPHYGDNGCATHSAAPAAQPNRGFRCCKMPQ